MAPKQSKVALRVGDWKIIGSGDLTHFELYNIAKDPQEKTDLAARQPERFERLKRQLIEHDKAVLADGPDWWKQDKRRRKKTKGGK